MASTSTQDVRSRRTAYSYPSSQPVAGPAPLASFEDLPTDERCSECGSPSHALHVPDLPEFECTFADEHIINSLLHAQFIDDATTPQPIISPQSYTPTIRRPPPSLTGSIVSITPVNSPTPTHELLSPTLFSHRNSLFQSSESAIGPFSNSCINSVIELRPSSAHSLLSPPTSITAGRSRSLDTGRTMGAERKKSWASELLLLLRARTKSTSSSSNGNNISNNTTKSSRIARLKELFSRSTSARKPSKRRSLFSLFRREERKKNSLSSSPDVRDSSIEPPSIPRTLFEHRVQVQCDGRVMRMTLEDERTTVSQPDSQHIHLCVEDHLLTITSVQPPSEQLKQQAKADILREEKFLDDQTDSSVSASLIGVPNDNIFENEINDHSKSNVLLQMHSQAQATLSESPIHLKNRKLNSRTDTLDEIQSLPAKLPSQRRSKNMDNFSKPAADDGSEAQLTDMFTDETRVSSPELDAPSESTLIENRKYLKQGSAYEVSQLLQEETDDETSELDLEYRNLHAQEMLVRQPSLKPASRNELKLLPLERPRSCTPVAPLESMVKLVACVTPTCTSPNVEKIRLHLPDLDRVSPSHLQSPRSSQQWANFSECGHASTLNDSGLEHSDDESDEDEPLKESNNSATEVTPEIVPQSAEQELQSPKADPFGEIPFVAPSNTSKFEDSFLDNFEEIIQKQQDPLLSDSYTAHARINSMSSDISSASSRLICSSSSASSFSMAQSRKCSLNEPPEDRQLQS